MSWVNHAADQVIQRLAAFPDISLTEAVNQQLLSANASALVMETVRARLKTGARPRTPAHPELLGLSAALTADGPLLARQTNAIAHAAVTLLRLNTGSDGPWDEQAQDAAVFRARGMVRAYLGRMRATEPPEDETQTATITIPIAAAAEFAAVLAPITEDELRGARSRVELIGFALRAAAKGISVDWEHVLGTTEDETP